MGLDQRIWADIEVNGAKKQVALHYWRKDYEIDEWFFSRLPEDAQSALEDGKITAWSCPLTEVELGLLEADDYALAFQLEFDLDLIWRCRMALKEGFSLAYSSSR